MNTTLAAIEDLGYAIETHGITADPASLSLLADDARELGVKRVLVDVMVDDFAPPVARVRAFARVSSTVAAMSQNSTTDRELALAC